MKLKNSITKKILTSLLIGVTLGTTLTGIAGNTAFADTNSGADFSQAKVVSVNSPQAQKVIRELQNRYIVTLQEVTKYGVTFVHVGQANNKLYLYKNGGGFFEGRVRLGKYHFRFGETLSALGGWYNECDGRYYYDPEHGFFSPMNCFRNINGEIFHFNTGGTIDRGWKTINGQSYQFNNRNGALIDPQKYGQLLICV